eukprot:scaffold4035_cov132-Isochrysis_galbana.AAC.3
MAVRSATPYHRRHPRPTGAHGTRAIGHTGQRGEARGAQRQGGLRAGGLLVAGMRPPHFPRNLRGAAHLILLLIVSRMDGCGHESGARPKMPSLVISDVQTKRPGDASAARCRHRRKAHVFPPC